MVRQNLKRIKTLLTKEQTQILETVFVLMLPALLTKVLGQVFNLILASFYGVDDSRLNQFFIANALPELLTTVLMVGAVGMVIIPVLISSKEEGGEERFYKAYSSILNVAVLTFSLISLIIIIFADQFIPAAIQLTGTEFLTSDAELSNIANMMRALILPQLIIGVSVFISSGLNVYNRFIIPQLSPLFYNLGRLSVVFLLVPIMDYSPWALVVAVYVGAVLHVLIPLPLFRSLKIKYYASIDWRDKYLREMLKLGLPRIIVLASDQIGILINSFISVAFLGGPAALTYAKSIYLVIPSLFGYTFAYASYPALSTYFIKNKVAEARDLIQKNLNQIIFMSLPFVVSIMVLRVPIVRLFFGLIPGTELSLVGTYQVAWILLFFSIGLVFITARWFLFSMFYAHKDTLIPSIISIVSLVAVVGLSILFTNFLSHNPNFAISTIEWKFSNLFERSDPVYRTGVGGISLAMSVTYTIEFFVLLIVFNKTKFSIGLRKISLDFGKKFVAAGLMFFFMYFSYKTWIPLSHAFPESTDTSTFFFGSTTVNLLLLTLVTVIPGFLIYFLMCHLFKVPELRILRKFLNPIFNIGGLKIR
jgi:putative peptidoglycan lipid II flippase